MNKKQKLKAIKTMLKISVASIAVLLIIGLVEINGQLNKSNTYFTEIMNSQLKQETPINEKDLTVSYILNDLKGNLIKERHNVKPRDFVKDLVVREILNDKDFEVKLSVFDKEDEVFRFKYDYEKQKYILE